MSKRKRDTAENTHILNGVPRKVFKSNPISEKVATVQIITGSYERVLHGIIATVVDTAPTKDPQSEAPVQFADSFLFNAHGSAIRTLAISPVSKSDLSQPQKVILASGGSDERVNLYNLSLSAPSTSESLPAISTLAGNNILESSKNRELGSLLHHTSSITALHFSSRSKLLSAAEDNTITVTRTRDWTVVSTIKVPQPKVLGRPSGDTAPFGGAPTGVNDFALHPSMKLMVSVGKGEKCMRLWNLVTGKKAGVLNFKKEILQGVGEGRWGSGEGRKIQWNGRGDQYAIAFERGAVVFGMDSKPICRLFPSPSTKLHQICYLSCLAVQDDQDLIAVSTEDGRIIFYSTSELQDQSTTPSGSSIPNAVAKGHIDGKSGGGASRIKDFEILDVPSRNGEFLVVTGSSNGEVRIWASSLKDFDGKISASESNGEGNSKWLVTTKEVGRLLGTYGTGNRITCLRAFNMNEADEDEEKSFEDFDTQEETGDDGSSGGDEA